MSTKRVEILEVEERTSKSGNKYRVCQCVVHGHDGKKKVGELMVFNKELTFGEGAYVVEFDVAVNFDRQVVAEPVRFIPFIEPAAVDSFIASATKKDAKAA